MTLTIRNWLAGTALLGAAALVLAPALPASAQQPKATQGAGQKAGPNAGQGAAKQDSEKDAEAPKLIELTQQQIDGLVTVQAELAKLPPADPKKPDPKIGEKVEAIAKKAGFAGAEEFGSAGDTVEAVLDGMDPESKAYVGPGALIRKQIAEVEANKTLPAKNKKAALKELNDALAAGDPPKPSAGNIDLVAKNFDKLTKSQGE